MNRFIRFAFALLLSLFAFSNTSFAQNAEDTDTDTNDTEIKMVNGTEEEVKVVIAFSPSPGDAPLVAKIISLKEMNSYEFFSIPKMESILIAALPASTVLNEMEGIPADLREKFIQIDIEGMDACDIVLKGSFEEGILFTLIE